MTYPGMQTTKTCRSTMFRDLRAEETKSATWTLINRA
jgi:hypothetical protein